MIRYRNVTQNRWGFKIGEIYPVLREENTRDFGLCVSIVNPEGVEYNLIVENSSRVFWEKVSDSDPDTDYDENNYDPERDF